LRRTVPEAKRQALAASRVRALKKKQPGRFTPGLPSILAFRIAVSAQGRPIARSKQVVASRWDTRRWSTGNTTILAYMTIVQQTTSFLTGCRRLASPCQRAAERPELPIVLRIARPDGCIIGTSIRKSASGMCAISRNCARDRNQPQRLDERPRGKVRAATDHNAFRHSLRPNGELRLGEGRLFAQHQNLLCRAG
jgi:hypothetical protein